MCVLLLIWLDSGLVRFPRNRAAACACAFTLYSLMVLFALRGHRNWSDRVRLLLHSGDLAWIVLFPWLMREPQTVLLTFLFVLIAAVGRWGPGLLIEKGGAVALIVSGELLLQFGAPRVVSADAFTSSDASHVSWGLFCLFVAALFWFLARLEATQRLENAAQVAQRTHARVSMELHDTVVQSLYTIECRLEKLLSKSEVLSSGAVNDLTRVQQLLHRTEVKLRDIVRQGRPLNLGSKTFVEYIRSLIAEFQQETGIAVSFVCDCGEISPSSAIASELVRIVQEALQNIRKHSGARNVSIGCRLAQGCWRFSINDDGQGFDFSGRLGMLELESLAAGPFVIRERVSTLGGELAIESTPGRGARLEIAVPKDALG